MTAPAISDQLEELFDLDIKCGGCWLGFGGKNIIECDAPAEYVMTYTHGGCKLYAPFKCRKCMELHITDLSRCKDGFSCAHCDGEFYEVSEFVRYGPI